MERPRALVLLLAAVMVPLFSLAIWFRVSSLKMPAPNGDEAFYGVQAANLLQGESIASKTASGNLLNLLVLIPEVVLYTMIGPSSYVLKIPAAIAGILAVLATYGLLSRAMDRTTALIAATLMAVLPITIIESRVGAEPAWSPLVGVIALAAAFRGHRLGLLLAFLLCYYEHSTYLFLLPVFGLVMLVKILERTEGDPLARWRMLAVTSWVGGAVLAPIALLTMNRPAVQWTYETYNFGPGDWPRYFLLFERLLMGFCEIGPYETSRSFDLTFWTAFLSILGAGSIGLVRQRRWDRLALIVGLGISLCGMHLVTGPDILRPYFVRYGLYLVAPTVLAIACCLRALLVPDAGGWQSVARRLQVAAMLGIAWVLLLGTKINYFDHVIAGHHHQESFWTLRTESVDPKEWVAEIIVNDIDAAPEPPTDSDRPDRLVVLAEDWWTYRPLEFWMSRRPDIEPGSLEHFDGPTRDRLIRKHLGDGGYLVGTVGKDVIARVKATFPPEDLKHWHVFAPPYECLAIYRLKRQNEARTIQPIAVLQPPGTGASPVIR